MSFTREILKDEHSRATKGATSKYSSDWVCDNCGQHNDYDSDH